MKASLVGGWWFHALHFQQYLRLIIYLTNIFRTRSNHQPAVILEETKISGDYVTNQSIVSAIDSVIDCMASLGHLRKEGTGPQRVVPLNGAVPFFKGNHGQPPNF